MRNTESDRELYLAVRQATFIALFDEPVGKLLLESEQQFPELKFHIYQKLVSLSFNITEKFTKWQRRKPLLGVVTTLSGIAGE